MCLPTKNFLFNTPNKKTSDSDLTHLKGKVKIPV